MAAGSGKTKRSEVAGGITLAACILLAVGVMTLFPACGPKDDGTWMSCHQAQLAVCAIACVMSLLSLVALFVRRGVGRWLHVIVAVLAVVAALVPGTVIPLCMMAGMQCRAVMRPSVILLGALIAVCAVVSTVLERGQRRA